jgi:hypothetical protein
MAIKKIVSGGQTGADRGALDAAILADLPHGGYCPQGRRAEDGIIPEDYILTEMSTPTYLARTEANVVDSDATLVFTYGQPGGGSLKTIEFAMKYSRPWHHINLDIGTHDDHVDETIAWLNGAIEDDPGPLPPQNLVLNVAGSRGMANPELQETVMHIMWDVLREVNPEFRSVNPYPDELLDPFYSA